MRPSRLHQARVIHCAQQALSTFRAALSDPQILQNKIADFIVALYKSVSIIMLANCTLEYFANSSGQNFR